MTIANTNVLCQDKFESLNSIGTQESLTRVSDKPEDTPALSNKHHFVILFRLFHLLFALFPNLAMVVLLRNVLARASRPVLSSSTVMGMITTTAAAATTAANVLHCDDGKKDSSAGIFPKNGDGNIAWNEFVSQVQNGSVFDIAARKAGDKVRECDYSMFKIRILWSQISSNLTHCFLTRLCISP